MRNNTYKFLKNIKYKTGALALIDPDSKNDKKLNHIVEKINFSGFDAILIGGSFVDDDQTHNRVKKIKEITSKPLILFPGSSTQVNKYVDAILYLSLISGRNSKYLIEEHVKSSLKIYKLNIETIPVGYILVDGERKSAVEKVSNTTPIDSNDFDLILSHALAGQYLGYKFIFLEAGSGAKKCIDKELIKTLKNYLKIPLIVGGGIVDCKNVEDVKSGNPDFIVIGNFLEIEGNIEEVKKMVELIHE